MRQVFEETAVKKIPSIILFLLLLVASATAQQIRVSPSSVTAYSQGATTVYLTFSGVVNKRPADACWSGAIVPAAPDIGFRSDPSTMFGCLPVRYDQSRLGAAGIYTDIMSIPPSVARKAYTDAVNGAQATFFYVRRFVSTIGGPDEFVPVTIRLGGNGSSSPFSLTDVKLSWGIDKPVVLINAEQRLPGIKAEITYTGSGRLKGRWELVKPGEELPSDLDLLTEASLPTELRALQRRYTLLNRFNIFLAPTGRLILPGPESWRVPSHMEGLYLVLLRIEAVEDLSGNSVLADIGGGSATIATGGVAGFRLPALRYYVGSSTGITATNGKPELVGPDDNAILPAGAGLEFRWTQIEGASLYRIEVRDGDDSLVMSAIAVAGTASYGAPSWLKDKLKAGLLKWRVVAFDLAGKQLSESPTRRLRFN
jgi:hypothetical protein